MATTLEKEIKQLLIDHKEFRDDDKALMWHIWTVMQHWKGDENYWKLHCLSPETIRRTRQKIQQENSWLRGGKYEQRKLFESMYREKYRKPLEE